MAQLQSPESDFDGTNSVQNQSIAIPAKFIAIADSFEKKEHSWFATSQIPTDLSILVQDITFNVHKFPLISRCGFIGRIGFQPSNSNLGYDIKLENFPGGPETFEIILKFCYGLPVSLNPNNVASLRCASEFLEMTEEFEDGNLIAKAEAFLTFVVLSSWRETITVLKSCETLSPWAENLQIVRRCCDSIAWKASQGNPTIGETINEESWWVEDVATLRINHFMRIITAIRAKGMKPETIGSCIMQYAEKWLPCMDIELEGIRKYSYGKSELQLSITSGRRQEGAVGNNKDQRMIIESLVSILPPQKEAASCKFLLWMLKMAIAYSASPALISELEKRVGMVLENANVNDLLIPSCRIGDQGDPINSPEERTMHNIDVVQRIIDYFLMHEQQQHDHQQPQQKSGKVKVSKLLDNYLAEIARDPNLSITKFQVLAEALPENARTCDDGLYRAIDTYLKTHPSLSEHDRRRLCKVMDCKKLSLDACMHAAQNDRLPLRTIIQVLFSEQVKIRVAMQGKEQAASGNISDQEDSWSSTKKDIMTLKAELEKVKMEMAEMQRDYSELQQEYEKLNHKQKNLSGWMSGWKKIKKSSLFHGKVDGDETAEREQRSNPTGCRVSFRRASLS
ncbi:BTB/POZ domain-containing protein DOT3 [Cornus florida]|uniref:BTB/POZ domain-containing protein DOT3 n=1 Tax=Cornus florida TaxID=4283 RepID=UPI0028992174|nr:BTB/POZ domain-containing protein DOT3 [Cornus florida]